MMKYALNHPWHFNSYLLAVFCGWLEVTMIFFFEGVKFYSLLVSPSSYKVMQNFVALAIISQIDDYFYKAISDRSGKRFIKKEY